MNIISKTLIASILFLASFSAPGFSQTNPACMTSTDIQKIVTDNQNAAFKFVRSMTDEEVLTVEKNVSAEYKQAIDLDHVDIYQSVTDPTKLRIILFDAKGCYKLDFPDTLEHTLKLLEETSL